MLQNMRQRPYKAYFLSAITTGIWVMAIPAYAQPDAQLLREREESRQGILTDDPADQVAKDRRDCMAGDMPATVQKSRGFGWDNLPDATEYCVTAAMRMANDGTLLQPYQTLVAELHGDPQQYQLLPQAIANAVMHLKAYRVSVGQEKAATITSALALDAGITVAYEKHTVANRALPEPSAIKVVAERCLALKEADLGLCYSTGYIYGLRAISGLPVAITQ